MYAKAFITSRSIGHWLTSLLQAHHNRRRTVHKSQGFSTFTGAKRSGGFVINVRRKAVAKLLCLLPLSVPSSCGSYYSDGNGLNESPTTTEVFIFCILNDTEHYWATYCILAVAVFPSLSIVGVQWGNTHELAALHTHLDHYWLKWPPQEVSIQMSK